VIRGQRASAGRAIGRAFVYRTGARSDRVLGPDAIIVAPTLLPTELPLLPAAGLVVETGGVLDHVAAQARERGIPAIVGARGACSAISDGDLVLLDADTGQLIRLG
jgi:pyruvate,water dikinase